MQAQADDPAGAPTGIITNAGRATNAPLQSSDHADLVNLSENQTAVGRSLEPKGAAAVNQNDPNNNSIYRNIPLPSLHGQLVHSRVSPSRYVWHMQLVVNSRACTCPSRTRMINTWRGQLSLRRNTCLLPVMGAGLEAEKITPKGGSSWKKIYHIKGS